ncbi:hypothetical protein G7Z17_g6005 [Cylindrodendrum hubeiense]|uniref:Heterokaryon incompatibility domain-containing protein n=1 Tax=Cylindrodendrum hubeiense TaxID=595255 RepID=A0A9P5HD45_9HYPO|nr:hypothetical protein G7Z17_g6005 [Cylindrodendrum hubeiense]
MAPDTVYEHTAITAPRTIRLMHLSPGSETDAVHLSLVTTALDAAPDFEAISYCWGDAQDEHQVTCNGAALSIRNSLFTGLVHFRHPDRPRILWADAVCINQADAAEKNRQVLLMPDVYSQATHVLVWLGIADDPVHGYVPLDVATSIRHAFWLLPSFDPENAEERAVISQVLQRDSRRLREEGKPNILDYDWKPLEALLARPWFRREVGGARDLACQRRYAGDYEAENARYRKSQQTATGDDGTKVERPKRQAPPHALFVSLHCVTSILMIQMYKDSGTLLDGVMATTYFNCTDPRDHVYSLLKPFFAGGKGKPILGVSEDQRVLSCQGRVIDTVKTLSQSLIEMNLAEIPEMRLMWEPPSDPSPKRSNMRFARWLGDCYYVAFGHSYSSEELQASGTEFMTAFSRTMPITSEDPAEFLCSYTWVKGKKPTIHVPGNLLQYKPPPRKTVTVKRDSKRDRPELKDFPIPRHPFEPTFRAMEAMNPDYKLNLYMVENTLIVERWEQYAYILVEGRRTPRWKRSYNYGHNFEKALTPTRNRKSIGTHHRLLKYTFGDHVCAVLSEVDAACDKHRDKVSGCPANPYFDGNVRAFRHGVDIPHDKALEIKSTWYKNSKQTIEPYLPQLWFGRTHNLIRGTHNKGHFDHLQVEDVKQTFQDWEKNNKSALLKLARILSVLRETVNESKYKACVAFCQKNSLSLRIHEKSERKIPLPENISENFWTSD